MDTDDFPAATLAVPSGDPAEAARARPSPGPSPGTDATPLKKRLESLKKLTANTGAKLKQIEHEIKGRDPTVRFRARLARAKREAIVFHQWASDQATALAKKRGETDDDDDRDLRRATVMMEVKAMRMAGEAQLLHGAVPPSI